MSLPTLFLPHHLGKALAHGHPWVYRSQIEQPPRLPSGTWIQLQCGKLYAYGLWDATSPIAVRVFSYSQVPDAAWIIARVRRAWEVRASIRASASAEAGSTTAYRWLYGEGDGVPGVVVDLYGEYAVLQTYAESLQTLLSWLVDALKACAPLKGVLRHDMDSGQLISLWGRLPRQEIVIEENGLRLGVNLFEGQKTGLFLDHRENRRYLEGWCSGRRVLNCFAYTGAFTLYAVRGGAREVVSADIAPQTAEAMRRNLTLNGFDPDAHPFVVGDCFDLLDRYAAEGEHFDLIILDPPSLAHAKKSKHAAIRAYIRLNAAAMRCLPSGGLLATASCTSQVSPEDFRDLLGEAAARANRRFLILHEAGHAIDHPVPAHFPEGRYLKFVLGRVENIF
ncbi:MAG: class I SAM-dependent rRNA methyltransferase [Anaerolineae bacterium]|nr:class I SAM-dependent rRNA methyltransferase [Anaerolineae bacterium]